MEKRYDHSVFDASVRQLWKEQRVYQQDKNNTKVFTVDTPPPTISGSLHIGHIFSYTQTDIIARYKRMTGHTVFYPFGFDDNGLPTEKFVEKKHKTSVGKIGREKFIELCLATTQEMKENFIQLWQNMGLSADFDKTYSTISQQVQKISQESFLHLLQNDFAYIKNEPALYCTKCRTTVAQAELDDVQHATTFNDVAFTTTDGKQLVIATTRPELLPSCVALLYHPSDERYASLKNQQAIVPLFNNQVPILEDDLVDPEKGTGLVMVCTFGDKTDIEWYKKHNLNYKQSIGHDGKFVQDTGPLAGLNVADARKKVLQLLQESNLLLEQKKIDHTVNVHERCSTAIEYIILPQWFIKVVEHKEKFLEAAEKIQWHPAHMKSRFIDWVSNLSWDWCISRQRVYGIPFPIWYCNDCYHVLTVSPDDLPIDPQVTKFEGSCPGCNGTNIRPEKDVMDTWNTSSLTPYICKQLYSQDEKSVFDGQSYTPMSMRPQAHDIIRTWAFYTIVKCWMHDKTIPWNEIVISGYVLSEQKEKISKSKGNAPTEPEQLLKLYAPDAIRFWTASGTLGQDVAFSPDQIKIGQKLLTKLWNAFKFTKMNLGDSYQHQAQPKHLGVVNQWIIDRSMQALANYKKYLDKHEFSLALQSVETFFWQDFCDNYIEIIKDQFFNTDRYDAEQVAATRWALYSTSFMILQMYAPYLPHITEYLYQQICKQHEGVTSIHTTQLPDIADIDETNQNHMNILLDIITQVRKLKTAHELALKTELAELTICVSNTEVATMLQDQQAILQGVCRAAKIIFVDEKHDTSLTTEQDTYKAWVSVSE